MSAPISLSCCKGYAKAKKTERGRKPLHTSVKDFCRLCGCRFKIKYGESAGSIATENLFQAFKVLSASSLQNCAEMWA